MFGGNTPASASGPLLPFWAVAFTFRSYPVSGLSERAPPAGTLLTLSLLGKVGTALLTAGSL